MANLSVTNTFVQGERVKASTTNQNNTDIENYINARNDGTTPWDNTPTLNMEAKGTPWYDVKAYGAVGDGVADDTAAIQAAVDVISGTPGGVVYIPKGTYNISSEILVTSTQVQIRGDGPDNTFVRTTTAAQNGIRYSTAGNGGIHNLQVNASVTKSAGAGILLDNSGEFYVKNVAVKGQLIGIDLKDENTVRISNCIISSIIETTGIGIRVDGSNDQYLDNIFIKGVGASNQALAGVQLLSTGAIFITKVGTIHCGTGLSIVPASTDEVNDVFMSNCAWDSSSADGMSIAPGASAKVRFLHSTGDWYTSNTANGIDIDGAGVIEDIYIIGARIINNGEHGVDLAAGADVSIHSCFLSQNSSASSGTSSGIQVAANVSQFSLIGNRSGQSASHSDTQNYGINVAAGTSNLYTIADNLLHNNITDGLVDGGTGDKKHVTGNLPLQTDSDAGFIGKYIESKIAVAANFPTTAQWGDLTSISLTAGDWDVSGVVFATANGATVTDAAMGIGTTSGNTDPGADGGKSAMTLPVSGGANGGGSLPGFRLVVASGSTTIYLKYYGVYSVATPQALGRISARKVR